MKEDEPRKPLEALGDEALEARIIAWVLGEASAFEAAELEERCEVDTDLKRFAQRMREVHQLIEADKSPIDESEWKLPEAKRQKVVDLLGVEVAKRPITKVRRVPVRILALAAAACLMGLLVFWGMSATMSSDQRKTRLLAEAEPASVRHEVDLFAAVSDKELEELSTFAAPSRQVAIRGRETSVQPVERARIRAQLSESLTLVEEQAPSDDPFAATLDVNGAVTSGMNGRAAGRELAKNEALAARPAAAPVEPMPPTSPAPVSESTPTTRGFVAGTDVVEEVRYRIDDSGKKAKAITPEWSGLGGIDAQADQLASLVDSGLGTDGEAKDLPALGEIPALGVLFGDASSVDGVELAGGATEGSDHWYGTDSASQNQDYGMDSDFDGFHELPSAGAQIQLEKRRSVGRAVNQPGTMGDKVAAADDDSLHWSMPKGSASTTRGEARVLEDYAFFDDGAGSTPSSEATSWGRQSSDDLFGRGGEGSADLLATVAGSGEVPAQSTPNLAYFGLQVPEEGAGQADFIQPSMVGDGWRDAEVRHQDNKKTSEDEFARRQLSVVESDRLLKEARKSYAEGDYTGAREKYVESLARLPEENTWETRREFLNKSLADAEVAEAEVYRRAGKHDESKMMLDSALQRDPGREDAIAQSEWLEDPIRTNPSEDGRSAPQNEATQRFLHEAGGSYELGRFDQAKEQYEQVLEQDPYNLAARRGLERINSATSDYYRAAYDETRSELLAQVDQAWDSTGGKPAVEPEQEQIYNFRFVDPGLRPSVSDESSELSLGELSDQSLIEAETRLKKVRGRLSENEDTTAESNVITELETIIPKIDFENTTVSEALDFLNARGSELDSSEVTSENGSVEFKVADSHLDSNIGQAVIPELKLQDVPLGEALNYIAESTRMRWSIEDDAITFKPATETAEDLFTKVVEVPSDFASRLVSPTSSLEKTDDPFADQADSLALRRPSSMKEMLESNGIHFPEGAQVEFSPETSRLVIRNTPSNLDLVERIIAQIESDSSQGEILDAMAEVSAEEEPYSTFSLHVSDASFKLAAAAIERGEVPDPEGIRPEEFYNAFDYGDPAPTADEPVACVVEQCAHPAFPQRNLLRIAVRTGAAGRSASTPLNLTLLMDNSGSMEREDRAEGLGNAVEGLSSLLKEGDTVTVAGFSRAPRLLADRIDGKDAVMLNGLFDQTPAEGGTNLEEALNLAGELAQRQFREGAQNRVVLFTDGAANLGDADPDSLNRKVEELRNGGIAFDAAGFGADGLNDRLLERLTRNGNGRYYVVDDPDEAQAGFAKQLAGAFRPAAENVKVQVVFNPARVGNYKLIGFEEHRLKKEDFRNDAVDAAEMAAEEAGVAVYQFEALPEGEGEIGEVRVRFRDTSTGEMVERSWPIVHDPQAPSFDQAKPSLQLAGMAALAAEKFRNAPLAGAVDYRELRGVMGRVKANYDDNERVTQLEQMLNANP